MTICDPEANTFGVYTVGFTEFSPCAQCHLYEDAEIEGTDLALKSSFV